MDLNDNIPEEFVDIVVQEFAYDPIRLPSAEDPSQVLYNRRTLETIWETKQGAINPYTRQPFYIFNVIPQTELKQQMCEYILNNRSLGLEVVADYTKILNQTEMKHLLDELVFAGKQCLRLLKKKRRRNRNRNRKPDDEELEHWKALWKKLNLVRLYCQYREENRQVFSSIKGYEYLFQVINLQLLYSCRKFSGSSCDDAQEVCKELARIVDVMGGLEEKDLWMVPEKSVLAFVLILFDLKHAGFLKIQTMVLRIYRGMVDNCINYLLRNKGFPIYYLVELPLSVLSEWESPRDVVNEDLYNGMTILRVAWISNVCLFCFPRCVEVLCMVVTVSISRLQELHDAVTARNHKDDAMNSSTSSHEDDNGEVDNNIHLLSMALVQGLFLIYYLLTAPHSEEDHHPHSRETLQSMDIVEPVVRMVKLVLAGNKFFQLSHLGFGLKIIALCNDEGGLSGKIKTELVRVFGDFLGSNYVEEYGAEVKWLLQYIVRCACCEHRNGHDFQLQFLTAFSFGSLFI
jgi:hypothetical protein